MSNPTTRLADSDFSRILTGAVAAQAALDSTELARHAALAAERAQHAVHSPWLRDAERIITEWRAAHQDIRHTVSDLLEPYWLAKFIRELLAREAESTGHTTRLCHVYHLLEDDAELIHWYFYERFCDDLIGHICKQHRGLRASNA